MGTWIFVTVMVGAVVAYAFASRRAKAKMIARFAERESLEFETFYGKFYAGTLDKALVKELIEHVAGELSVPASKLRPEDRFDDELKPLRGWEFDSGRNILLVELVRLARARNMPVDLRVVKNLDDYIRLMAKVY